MDGELITLGSAGEENFELVHEAELTEDRLVRGDADGQEPDYRVAVFLGTKALRFE